MTKIPSNVNEGIWIDNALKQKKYSKDLEKIISVQERIITAKESEFQQIEKLFRHYLDRKDVYAWWYTKYRWLHEGLVATIKNFDNKATVEDLKLELAWKEDPEND